MQMLLYLQALCTPVDGHVYFSCVFPVLLIFFAVPALSTPLDRLYIIDT
uniref:Uncharacterized protein n=1 Tax=Anguilla anguilla TaxID=7936 RepID=A0A0E9XGR5_ANGAN